MPITPGGPQLGGSAPPQQSSTPQQYSTFAWLVAWAVLMLFLFFVNKSKIGHLLIYYGLVLLIVFVIVTQASWFAGVLAPFSSLAPGLVPGQASQTQNVSQGVPQTGGTQNG